MLRCSLSFITFRIEVGALVQQQLDHICATIQRSHVQWGNIINFRVDNGAFVKQQFGHMYVIECRSSAECSGRLPITLVDFGALVQQQFDHIFVA